MKLKLNVNLWRVAIVAFAVAPVSLIFQQTAFALISSGLPKDSPKKEKSEIALNLKNWGLDNSFASHIDVKKAWGINRGSKNIVVAVIDTGIDPKHPDLEGNLWKKPGSIETKTVDGKKVETFEYGWDFVTNTRNPVDVHGHGSHVAGIVAASGKSNSGAMGVAPNVSIMAIRYYSASVSGAVNLANTIKAIHYAIDNGANIINYSGGGAEFSAAEKKAIERAQKKGILFVAAAGNEHRDTDKDANKFYPGAYGLSNVISVAATDINNQLLSSSNWGGQSVHVAAPGENIFSTAPNKRFGYLTGTSQGTAFVSGLAALLMSQDASLKSNPEKVKEIILGSVDKIASLKGKVISGGRINAYAALAAVANKVSGVQLAQTAHNDGAAIADIDTQPVTVVPNLQGFEEQRLPARKHNSVDAN